MISSWIFDEFIICAPFFSFHPHPRYPSQMRSSSTGNLYNKSPFSPHISGCFATNLRYVECEKRVFLDYATLLRFVEVDIRWAAYSFNAFCVHTPVNITSIQRVYKASFILIWNEGYIIHMIPLYSSHKFLYLTADAVHRRALSVYNNMFIMFLTRILLSSILSSLF